MCYDAVQIVKEASGKELSVDRAMYALFVNLKAVKVS